MKTTSLAINNFVTLTIVLRCLNGSATFGGCIFARTEQALRECRERQKQREKEAFVEIPNIHGVSTLVPAASVAETLVSDSDQKINSDQEQRHQNSEDDDSVIQIPHEFERGS